MLDPGSDPALCTVSCRLARMLLIVVFVLGVFGAPRILRAQDPDPTRFAEQIEAYQEADREAPPPEGGVLFVGSSSIRMWSNLDEDFPEVTAINRGFGGSQFSDLLYYLEELVLTYRPRQIFVYEGDNDVAAGKSPEEIYEDYRTFVRRVRTELPDAQIGFIAIKPSPSRWELAPKMRAANRLIRRHTLWRADLEYVDVFTPMLASDGRPRPEIFQADELHMNRAGYRLWRGLLAPYVHAGQ